LFLFDDRDRHNFKIEAEQQALDAAVLIKIASDGWRGG
jgi:hypothetical protein